jgi:hypothetical protein
MLPSLAARQVWVSADAAGYSFGFDQGGTGTSGVDNCTGTVFNFTTAIPKYVVATVTVVNTVASGALQAWNGGPTLSAGAVVNWIATERLSNTTVIPMNRFVTEYPGSGAKRDIGINNNSGAAIDVVIDVLGFFIENAATALECTVVTGTTVNLPASSSQLIFAPSCPAGFTAIVGQPVTNVFGVYTGTLFENACRINNATGGTLGVNCNAYCCRVPGI